MGRFTVIYDACVLYPAPLRDLLLQLAISDLFRARWTNEIHEEWISTLLHDRPDLTRKRLEGTRDKMNGAVMDCLIDGYDMLIPTINLPDPNDRHVVAAAISGHADAIVTFNLKDFPPSCLSTYAIEAIHPDDFILSQIDLDLASVLIAAQRCLARLKNPTKTAHEYLDTLHRQSLPKSVTALRPYAAVLSPER